MGPMPKHLRHSTTSPSDASRTGVFVGGCTGVAITVGLLAAGCASSQHSTAANMMKPSHPPTTAEQWTAMEEEARTAVSGEHVVPPTRLENTGTFVEYELPLQANSCYELGLSWQFELPAYVSVMFQPNADGTLPNDHLAGRRERLTSSGQTLSYCADRDGVAKLNVAALDAQTGATRPNELLEYVLVVAGKAETESETQARRSDEANRASQSQAVIDANIKRAEEEERAALRRAQTQCAACQTAYLTCIGNGGSEGSCSQQFQSCRGSLDGYLAESVAGPCRRP